MGGGGSGVHQTTTSVMPESALSADKRIHLTKSNVKTCLDELFLGLPW